MEEVKEYLRSAAGLEVVVSDARGELKLTPRSHATHKLVLAEDRRDLFEKARSLMRNPSLRRRRAVSTPR